jgi:hypothetical protein
MNTTPGFLVFNERRTSLKSYISSVTKFPVTGTFVTRDTNPSARKNGGNNTSELLKDPREYVIVVGLASRHEKQPSTSFVDPLRCPIDHNILQ